MNVKMWIIVERWHKRSDFLIRPEVDVNVFFSREEMEDDFRTRCKKAFFRAKEIISTYDDGEMEVIMHGRDLDFDNYRSFFAHPKSRVGTVSENGDERVLHLCDIVYTEVRKNLIIPKNYQELERLYPLQKCIDRWIEANEHCPEPVRDTREYIPHLIEMGKKLGFNDRDIQRVINLNHLSDPPRDI